MFFCVLLVALLFAVPRCGRDKDRITKGSGFWVLVLFLELSFWKDRITSGKGFWILWFGILFWLVVLFCFLLIFFAGAFVLLWCVVLSFCSLYCL